MQDEGYERDLKVMNKRHDLICLCVDDELETELPNIGLVPFLDSETGNWLLTDTSDKKTREAFRKKRLQEREELHKKLNKLQVDHVHLFTNHSYIEPLVNMFQKRQKRH